MAEIPNFIGRNTKFYQQCPVQLINAQQCPVQLVTTKSSRCCNGMSPGHCDVLPITISSFIFSQCAYEWLQELANNNVLSLTQKFTTTKGEASISTRASGLEY